MRSIGTADQTAEESTASRARGMRAPLSLLRKSKITRLSFRLPGGNQKISQHSAACGSSRAIPYAPPTDPFPFPLAMRY